MKWTLIPLIFIGILAFLIFIKIGKLFEQRKFQLSKILSNTNEVTEKKTKLDKILAWINPNMAVKEANRLGFNFTMKHYTRDYVIGFLISFGVLYVFYRNLPMMLLGASISGFLIPNVRIYQFKRKYEERVKSSLISYFKRFSSTLRSYEFNVAKSLEDVLESTDESIKGDLEKVLFDIKQGTSPERTFRQFNNKYKYKGVKLFHDMVILVSEMGSDEQNLLRSSANKFSRKRYWQNKLVTQNSKFVRESNVIGAFSIFIVISIMVISNEYYLAFVNSIIGKGSITMCVIWYIVTMFNINKIANADPTETN